MAEPLLVATGLVRRYRRSDGAIVAAVDGIDLEVARGEALGIAGGTGAGKSTLVRLLLGVERPDAGDVRFDRRPLGPGPASRPLRRRLGVVLQDPTTSLNPRLRIGTAVAEGLAAHGIGTAAERRRRVAEVLAEVGLDAALARRRPAELSGGERQRAAIARALAPGPELLLLDEPVTALDATVQRRVLALVAELKARRRLTIVVVSHDLRVLRAVCDRALVMLAGRVVESGPAEQVLTAPAHPYAAALCAAAPGGRRPGTARDRTPTGPAPPPDACRWLGRCPRAVEHCVLEPGLEAVGDERRVRCWNPVRR